MPSAGRTSQPASLASGRKIARRTSGATAPGAARPLVSKETWLGNGYSAGDAWGCIGRWFSGDWYGSSQNYINTVKSHLKSIYRKLAVTHRGEAVRRARQLRILGPGR